MQLSKIKVETSKDSDGTITYHIIGQIFFASTEPLMNTFDFHDDSKRVVLDFAKARLWDESAATVLKKAMDKFESNGKEVEVCGLDENSVTLVNTLYGVTCKEA